MVEANFEEMKYADLQTAIPQAKRAEYNAKILHLVRAGRRDLSAEQIANAYTGNGGLHGLEFDDFDSRTAFGAAKKLFEQGQFFTPHAVAQAVVELIKPQPNELIGDLTCGIGAFFNFCPNEHNCYGCELDHDAFVVAEHLYPNANLEHNDVLYYDPGVKFDIVFGNPPFNLYWRKNGVEVLSQFFYLQKAHELLHAGGMLVMIAPKTFLEDDFSNGRRIEWIDDNFGFIGQYVLPLHAFARVGVERFQTKVVVWQKL